VSAATLDLTGVVCPLNWVKTKLALEELAPGDELSVRLDPGEPLESVPRSASEDGHGVSVSGSVVTIVKGRPAADAAGAGS
jgi:TusA-related sulfurtransferase